MANSFTTLELRDQELFRQMQSMENNLLAALDRMSADMKAQFADMKAQFQDVKAQFQDVKAQFQDVKAEFQDVKAEFQDVKAEFQDVKAQFQDVKAQLQDVKGEIRRNGKRLHVLEQKTGVRKEQPRPLTSGALSLEEQAESLYHPRQQTRASRNGTDGWGNDTD